MSHLLDFTLGRAAIAYRGQVPWHGYGATILPTDTPDEIRTKAGLDYDVIERAIYYSTQSDGKNVPTKIDSRKALLRGDTQDFLSIVGKDYCVVQPGKVFEFFKDLVAQQGLSIETAGALDQGRKIWALAKVDDDFTIYGQDTISPYVLVATSYDGTLATVAQFTSVRVVCNNTLTFSGAYTADGDAKGVFKVRHDKEFNISAAHGKLGLNEEAWIEYKRQQEQLAAFKVSPDELLEYFYTVAGQDKGIVRNEDNGKIISFPEPGRVVKQFINAYKNGPGANLVSARNTLFGAVNAVTYYQDHVAPASDRGQRFNSATFGGGNVRKQHALNLAVERLQAA